MGYQHLNNLYADQRILRHTVIAALEKIHGCFAPETLVMLPNGEERPIGEIIDDPNVSHILSYHIDREEFIPRKITGRFRRQDPVSQWVRLTLENGRVLHCTEDHPIFSRDRKGYVRADSIREGEDIESPVL